MLWLLSCSLKAALLLAASWIGAVLLRRAAAAARHQIWALGVAGALLLPLLCWAMPSLLPAWEAPATGAARTFQGTIIYVTGGPAGGAGSMWPAWPVWLAIAWGAGTILVSLRFLRAHLAARRLSRRAEPARADSWLSARAEAAASLAMPREVSLGRSEAIASPMTIGVLRARVLLPAAADGWSPERLRAVLIHELAHVRRRDALIQLGAQLACALYWWNPLAWLAAARLRVEREHACDDLVLRAGIRPSSYAADLLDVARAQSIEGAARAGALSMVDRSWMERRLRRILDAAIPRRPLGAPVRAAVGAAAVALTVTLACASRPTARPAPESAPAAGPAATGAPARTGPAAATGAAAAASGANGPLWLGRPARLDETEVPRVLLASDPSDMSFVTQEIERHARDLEQCYRRRLAVRPEIAGHVIARWTITAGRVSEYGVTVDMLQDDEVLSCVKKVVLDVRFPVSSDGPVEVSLPFFFGTPPPPDDGC